MKNIFRHIGIVVYNMEMQLKFYNKLLKLDIIYNEIEEGEFISDILNKEKSVVSVYKLGRNNNTIVELLFYLNEFNTPIDKKISQNGITHFAITVDNLDSLYESLILEGVEFLSIPKVNKIKSHKVCFCQDFEGNFIELVEEL